MKRRKLLFILLLLRVCELEFVNSKHHHKLGAKHKKNHRFYNNMFETNKYIGKTNLFKLDEEGTNQGEYLSQMRQCSNCHRTGNNNNFKNETNSMYNKDSLESTNNLMKKSQKNKGNNKLHKHYTTKQGLNEKRSVLMKMKDTLKGYENTAPVQYGPPNPNGYPPNGQDPYTYPSNGYSGPTQAPDQSGYQPAAPPNGYGPPPNQYGPTQPQGGASYVPESYPEPGSLPEPGAADYAKPAPDTGVPPSNSAVPQQPPGDMSPYGDQSGMEPAAYNPYPNSYQPENEVEDIHDSFKCKFLAFLFEECLDRPKKIKPAQYQPPTPMTPVAQQYCNMYGTSDLNLSDFEPSSNDWLVVNQNNSLRLTSNKPVQSNMQTLELKGNYCNNENFSCTLQLGENSTAGLSVRGMGNQKTLVELNSLTKTVSLKQVNDGTTQVLLEIPWAKLNSNFLHLVQVNDGGFKGTFTVLLDGEQVFTKNDLPTKVTGLMGLFISSGNASFGNLSVTPVSS